MQFYYLLLSEDRLEYTALHFPAKTGSFLMLHFIFLITITLKCSGFLFFCGSQSLAEKRTDNSSSRWQPSPVAEPFPGLRRDGRGSGSGEPAVLTPARLRAGASRAAGALPVRAQPGFPAGIQPSPRQLPARQSGLPQTARTPQQSPGECTARRRLCGSLHLLGFLLVSKAISGLKRTR